jgi:hypothetical protein
MSVDRGAHRSFGGKPRHDISRGRGARSEAFGRQGKVHGEPWGNVHGTVMSPMKRVSKATAVFAIHVLVVGAACARAGSTTDGETGSGSTSSSGGAPGGDAGHGASSGASGAGSSSGDVAGSSSGAVSDDGSAGTDDASDDASDDSGDDASGDDAASDASGSGSSGASSGSSGSSGASPTYTCVTGLSPAPVCDSKHTNCLCTADAECNSGGTNVGNKGGCNSGHCAGGACTGGPFTDSAGCSVVGAFCNLSNANDACPTGTTCEENHGQCGGSAQCCWCTSDSACPVSGKCINDATQKQCGSGTCTGTGTSWDGMHCQLASPGIPMCSMK